MVVRPTYIQTLATLNITHTYIHIHIISQVKLIVRALQEEITFSRVLKVFCAANCITSTNGIMLYLNCQEVK